MYDIPYYSNFKSLSSKSTDSFCCSLLVEPSAGFLKMCSRLQVPPQVSKHELYISSVSLIAYYILNVCAFSLRISMAPLLTGS